MLGTNAKKNKNHHENFVPFLNFSEEHLPERYRHEVLVRLINVLASLTVRLRVYHISGCRPENYTFWEFKNMNLRHFGSGWVYRVSLGDGPCLCLECAGQFLPRASWWKCEVFTACHVVYDKKEAQCTKVDLDYNDENSKVTTLSGYGVQDNSQDDDVCIIQCATHDRNVSRRLMEAIQRYELLKWEVREALMSTLCVVISHPHGKPKKVTVGEMVDRATHDPENSHLVEYMYKYSADTCNGSSGAPVLSAVSRKPPGTPGVWPGTGPHSRGHVDGLNNQCSPGIFYIGADILSRDLLKQSMQQLKTASSWTTFSFILVGKTGVGKSALGNSILREKVLGVSSSVESATKTIQFATSQLDGKTIKVVDMMGIGDTRMSAAEGTTSVLEQLNQIMAVTSGESHVFLLIFRFGERFTREDQHTVLFLKNVFGEYFVRHSCILIMTHGDNFYDLEPGPNFIEWCRQQSGPFRDLFEECEHRALLFENATKNEELKTNQLQELLQTASKLYAEGRRYTDNNCALNADTIQKISTELKEPEVSERVLLEESLILRELRACRSDTQALRILQMRATSLLRYVKREDGGSGSFSRLVHRVATLCNTVDESFRAEEISADWITRMSVLESMANEEVDFQRDWFRQELDHLNRPRARSPGSRGRSRHVQR